MRVRQCGAPFERIRKEKAASIGGRNCDKVFNLEAIGRTPRGMYTIAHWTGNPAAIGAHSNFLKI